MLWPTTVFWLTAAALAIAAAALLAAVLTRRAAGTSPVDAEADMAIYRDQLAEVRRDEARGVLDPAEAERLRLEVSRRVLEADRKVQADTRTGIAPAWLNAAAVVGVAALVGGGSLALYAALGSPGLRDRPIATRIAEAEAARAGRAPQRMAEAEAALMLPRIEADPEFARLLEQVRAAVADNPGDVEGLRLLAQHEARLGNLADARRAQGRILELRGEAADLRDWERYAELLIQAAGGYVSREAERALAEVLRRDPQNRASLFYLGLLHVETGRPDWAFRLWRRLLEGPPTDAPWMTFVRENIGALAALAGEEYRPPAPPPPPGGPTEADVAAAADMSPQARGEMVRAMVDGLAARLAREGGPPEDWARLIASLGVLGDREGAGAIYAEAREVFAGKAQALALIEGAADSAGIAQ